MNFVHLLESYMAGRSVQEKVPFIHYTSALRPENDRETRVCAWVQSSWQQLYSFLACYAHARITTLITNIRLQMAAIASEPLQAVGVMN